MKAGEAASITANANTATPKAFARTVVLPESTRLTSSCADIAARETGVFVQDAFIAGTRNRNARARDVRYATKRCRIVDVTSTLTPINRLIHREEGVVELQHPPQ
ncbi:hypothetical protein [uncultured Butyricimonas sp.]|uniref:hypothetical protein n=1 Tax=uncultured Butyricimonas sp. TaxID=1268785 RepID=UPI0026DB1616|nr:hypothetical protein [uncultured Butyricimonas sp.]